MTWRNSSTDGTIVTVRRNYKFLLRPTSRQEAELTRQLALHCELYNAALQERRDAWKAQRKSISFYDQCRQLKDIRRERPDIGALRFHSAQATIRRLDLAFQAFFRRVKAGQTPGFPRFKSVARFDSMTYCHASEAPYDVQRHRLRVHGVGHVRVHQHRAMPAGCEVKTVTLKREGRRWYVILSCDKVPAEPLPGTEAVTGIDLGVVSFLTTSEGEHVANLAHGAASRARLVKAQRVMRRCKRGSQRAHKAVRWSDRFHRKVKRQRLDTAHKVALDLVRRHDTIVHEKLRIKNMTRSAKGQPRSLATRQPRKLG